MLHAGSGSSDALDLLLQSTLLLVKNAFKSNIDNSSYDTDNNNYEGGRNGFSTGNGSSNNGSTRSEGEINAESNKLDKINKVASILTLVCVLTISL